MASCKQARKTVPIAARCEIARDSFPIGISDITPDGCSVEADAEWDEDFEFIHLTIDGRVDVNGRVEWHKGRRAGIRFFGQIHPSVIDDLARARA